MSDNRLGTFRFPIGLVHEDRGLVQTLYSEVVPVHVERDGNGNLRVLAYSSHFDDLPPHHEGLVEYRCLFDGGRVRFERLGTGPSSS